MQTPKTEQEAFTTENRARGLSRRAFLTGTALLGLGGAVTALGGCAPQSTASSSEAAPENTGTSASGTSEYPWPDAPEAIAEDRIEETLEADAVIVGLGVSGVAAFRSAAEEGLSVIAVEKGTAPQCRSDNYCYVNGSLNERLGLPELDIDELAQEEWGNSGGYSNYRIVRKFMQNESEVFDWWAAGDPDIYYPSSPRKPTPSTGSTSRRASSTPTPFRR